MQTYTSAFVDCESDCEREMKKGLLKEKFRPSDCHYNRINM